ncbi:hypothetical protein HDU96_000124 [Phlyctochytrium bullatum]|nr:hypothetical protein HDU96_000124 [Phlyctochytrium bullatum]
MVVSSLEQPVARAIVGVAEAHPVMMQGHKASVVLAEGVAGNNRFSANSSLYTASEAPHGDRMSMATVKLEGVSRSNVSVTNSAVLQEYYTPSERSADGDRQTVLMSMMNGAVTSDLDFNAMDTIKVDRSRHWRASVATDLTVDSPNAARQSVAPTIMDDSLPSPFYTIARPQLPQPNRSHPAETPAPLSAAYTEYNPNPFSAEPSHAPVALERPPLASTRHEPARAMNDAASFQSNAESLQDMMRRAAMQDGGLAEILSRARVECEAEAAAAAAGTGDSYLPPSNAMPLLQTPLAQLASHPDMAQDRGIRKHEAPTNVVDAFRIAFRESVTSENSEINSPISAREPKPE